jgi:hypothetical protein
MAMEAEHCKMYGSDEEFEAPSHCLTTTPRKEYEIICGKRDCPMRDRVNKQGKLIRFIHNIEELRLLKVSIDCGLQEIEIAALVNTLCHSLLHFDVFSGNFSLQALCSGPMLVIYNAMLNRCPRDLFSRFSDGGNVFCTTVHVIMSAIVKISRIWKNHHGSETFSPISSLQVIPSSFHSADDMGCRGFLTWGFLTATTKSEAIEVLLIECDFVHQMNFYICQDLFCISSFKILFLFKV